MSHPSPLGYRDVRRVIAGLILITSTHLALGQTASLGAPEASDGGISDGGISDGGAREHGDDGGVQTATLKHEAGETPKSGTTLTVIVTDDNGPVRSAQVRISAASNAGSWSTWPRTNPDGKVTFQLPISDPPEVEVTVLAENYESKTQRVRLSGGAQRVQIRLVLRSHRLQPTPSTRP